jgi:hypothetical protein
VAVGGVAGGKAAGVPAFAASSQQVTGEAGGREEEGSEVKGDDGRAVPRSCWRSSKAIFSI